MKRQGYIYEKIYDINNILNALNKASKKKRKRKDVKKILENKEYYAKEIQAMLVNHTYKPNPYIQFTINFKA